MNKLKSKNNYYNKLFLYFLFNFKNSKNKFLNYLIKHL